MRPIDADAISYIQAIDATSDLDYVRRYNIDRMPTIDTTPIRQEQAIDFLQKSGWLPEHDRVLTEYAVPVKHGEWIWMGEQGDSRHMCSVCKGKEKVPTILGEPIVWEYCPNCGAKMDGERKDNG